MGTPVASPKGIDLGPDGGGKHWWDVLTVPATVLLWAIVNSQLLVLNKLFVYSIPASSFLLLVHTAFCAGVIDACKRMGLLEADDLTWEKTRIFIPVVLSFVGTLYANLKVLERLNVDTFVCFRASLPLALSIIEPFFLNRRLPTARSISALVAIICGVVIYVGNDQESDVWGFVWLGIWFVITVYETLVVKHVISTVEMTTWGRSFYQNLLSIPFCAVLMLVNNEKVTLLNAKWDAKILVVLVASAAVGIGMSALSFKVREMVSVTAFSVAGNVAKVGTILVNCLMWENHATPSALAGLGVALAGCAFYQQAPLREPGESLLEPLLRPFQEGGAGLRALLPTTPSSAVSLLAVTACVAATVLLGRGGGGGGGSAGPAAPAPVGVAVAAPVGGVGNWTGEAEEWAPKEPTPELLPGRGAKHRPHTLLRGAGRKGKSKLKRAHDG